MSFYGNSYQYLAETFARIILKNSGIDNSEFTTLSSKELGPLNISATEVDSGLTIDSGNKWITLKPIYKEENPLVPHGFEIWHSAPLNEGTLIKAVPEASSTVTDAIDQETIKLNFEDYLRLPVITYDEAGHSMPTEETYNIRLPADPSGPFYDRLWKVDGINPNGEEKDPPGGSLKTKLLKRMKQIDGCDDTGTYQEGETESLYYRVENDMSTLHGRVDEWDDKIIKAAQDVEDTEKLVEKLQGKLETNIYNKENEKILTSDGNTITDIKKDITEIYGKIASINEAIVKLTGLIN